MPKYEDMPGIRRSDLWLIHKSPMHFKFEIDNPTAPTPAMLFGSAAHKYILEPDTFFDEYAIAPMVDKRTKAGKEAWEEFCMMCNDNSLEPISADDFQKIKDMSVAIDAHPIARKLLTGQTEQIFTWVDNLTGEACKCKLDCLTDFYGERLIVDYKTTDSCEDGHFERSCKKYGYKFQAGMYREAAFQNTLLDYRFVFVAQEKTEPYAVRCYHCTEEFVSEGYDQFRTLLGVYHDCRQSGDWYGYEGVNPADTGYFTMLMGEDEYD